MRLAVMPASYIDSPDGVTPPELASRVSLFLNRLQSAANSTWQSGEGQPPRAYIRNVMRIKLLIILAFNSVCKVATP